MLKKEEVEIEIPRLEILKKRDPGNIDQLLGLMKVNNHISQPLIVMPKKGKPGFYVVVAGYRRYLAAIRLGLLTVPCIIRDFTSPTNPENKESLEPYYARIEENSGRKDFSHMEEARELQQFKDKGQTDAQVGQRIGRSPEYVNLRTGLLKLEPEVKMMLGAGEITVSHAERLEPIKDRELQVKLANSIITEKLSVLRLENKIKKTSEPKIVQTVQPAAISSILQTDCSVDETSKSLLGRILAQQSKGKCDNCSKNSTCRNIQVLLIGGC